MNPSIRLFCLLLLFGLFPFFVYAQDKIDLKTFKIRQTGKKASTVKVLLGEDLNRFSWDRDLGVYLETTLKNTFAKESHPRYNVDSLIIYLTDLVIEPITEFKDYGRGTAIFYFFESKGDSLIKHGSIKVLANTKYGYLPALLLEKAITDFKFETYPDSEFIKLTTLDLEKHNRSLAFEPKFEFQIPGVYLSFDDLKTNSPILKLDSVDLKKILPTREYLSFYISKKIPAFSNVNKFWGVYTGKEYLVNMRGMLVKLHELDGDLVFPLSALDQGVAVTSPGMVNIEKAMDSFSDYLAVGLIGFGFSKIAQKNIRNNPNLENRLFYLDLYHGFFNFSKARISNADEDK